MTRGEFAIIAVTVLVVLAVFLWIAVDKIEGIEPGCIVGGCGARLPGSEPRDDLRIYRHGPRDLLDHRKASRKAGHAGQPPILFESGRCGVEGNAGHKPEPLEQVEDSTPLLATPGSRFDSGQRLHFASDANRTGRAARGGVSGAASARLRADAKMAQARLVCSFPPVRQALDMLRLHESVNGTQMVGDGGLAQGWLNQHEGHWNDGCEVLGVSWKWPDDTRDLAKCEMVAVGYWMRYARAYLAAGNVEELVRRFRLPFAPYRADNDRYWQKVKRATRSGKGRSGR